MDEAEPVPNSTSSSPEEVPASNSIASSSASYGGPPAHGDHKSDAGPSNFGSGAASTRPRAANKRTKLAPSCDSATTSNASASAAKRSRKNTRGGDAVTNHTLDSFFSASPSKQSGSASSSASAAAVSSCVGYESGSEGDPDEENDPKFELDPDVRAILRKIQQEEGEENLIEAQLKSDNDACEPAAANGEMTVEEADKLCEQIDIEELIALAASGDSSPPAVFMQPVIVAPRRSHMSLTAFAHHDSDTNEDETLSLNNSPLPSTYSQRSDAAESISFNASPLVSIRPNSGKDDFIDLADSDDDEWLFFMPYLFLNWITQY